MMWTDRLEEVLTWNNRKIKDREISWLLWIRQSYVSILSNMLLCLHGVELQEEDEPRTLEPYCVGAAT